jgi:hypothetical protein
MTFRSIVLALFAMACGPVQPIGGGMCTEIGCSDGFDGRFSPEFTEPGDYEFILEIDGVTSTCAYSLPLDDSGSCDGVLQVVRSGSALPASEHSLPSFSIFEVGFAEFTLTVTRDGVEEASWTESPEWEVLQPNGPECGPTCEVAGVTLTRP